MSLKLLYLPSEIIALIGKHLEYRRDIKAFIETHPRFCCLAQLYESLYGAGNIFVHKDDLMTACDNGDEPCARRKLKSGALPWGRYCFSHYYTDISYPMPTAARNGYYGVVKQSWNTATL
ncbi:hypothetical protein N7493_010504 [Penicillium malachiteum]|uniref:Uncharacterized protein n=1 Tax=Penicillium malachiteum TaxID=1324776 RepID=A0AAD6HD15_9EURO|nr:hypothetical protein N7493_010504 [Penicillium malachiteum]